MIPEYVIENLKAHITPAATADVDSQKHLLASLMTNYSEDSWSAGWIIGLEFDLWHLIHNPETKRDYIDYPALYQMAIVANKVGGWIVWDDDSSGLRKFIPFDKWIPIYSKWEALKPEDRYGSLKELEKLLKAI
jgi:hypothetical protein